MRSGATMKTIPAAALLTALAWAAVAPVGAADGLASVKSREAFAPPAGMTSEFADLVNQLREKDAKGRIDFVASRHKERGNEIFVLKDESAEAIEAYVWLSSWSPAVIAAVKAAGAEITEEDPERLLLQAWVPLEKVEAIAAVPGVRHLRRPSYGVTALGAVTTEGDSALGTRFIRSLSAVGGVGSISGAGTRIGVISRGLYNGLFPYQTLAQAGARADSRVQSKDLPPYTGTVNPPLGPTSAFLGGVRIFPQSHISHDIGGVGVRDLSTIPEGAAMLEILYDIAPGAQYFYGRGNTDIELRTVRNTLLGQGVNLFVDDVVFYDSGRFDGTSAVSRQAQSIVLRNNVAYVTATGSYTPPTANGVNAEGTVTNRFPLFINGYFSPLPGFGDSKFHNFANTTSATQVDNSLTVAPLNGVLDVILVWDDVWDDANPRASIDMDLFLFNENALDQGSVIAFSSDLQNGVGRPIERITRRVDISQNYWLTISRKDSVNSANTLFTLVILQGIVSAQDAKYLTHGIAGNNGDALPPVITVGAVDATEGVFSADVTTVPGLNPGPGLIDQGRFIRWFNEQRTPSVVSYSRVSTRSSTYVNELGQTFVGPFFGTSPAAAHIGGLIALLKEDFPRINAWDYYSILRDTSITTSGYPNATPLNEQQLAVYANAPRYLRVNGLDTWLNLQEEEAASGGRRPRRAPVAMFGEANGWESSAAMALPFASPDFGQSPMGIELSPGGRQNVFGFWQTPLLELPADDGSMSTELRSDRLYELTVRVGSNETDPLRVPDFRLRLTSGQNNESALLTIAGTTADAAVPPTTIAGKTYTLYYRPTNEKVAREGVRFAFDLIHFNERDNSNATLFLQDVQFRELNVPAE